jgi:hypothetical protein
MYESDYFIEQKASKKNSITSVALTTGVITILIIGLILAARCIVASGC